MVGEPRAEAVHPMDGASRGHAHDDDRDDRQDERDVVDDDERQTSAQRRARADDRLDRAGVRERRRELHGHDPRAKGERRGHSPAARRSCVRTPE